MDKQLDAKNTEIINAIFEARGMQVMLDKDLATLFQIETKNLNKAVKRNEMRFPDYYRFQLTDEEWNNLRFQFGTSSAKHGGSRYLPYVFTEQGVAMLSAVLNSEIAIKVSIQIINAFVQMRQQLKANTLIDFRISSIERKQLETDQKFEQLFNALEQKNKTPQQGIFFEGQVFDAYSFVSDIIRGATHDIILIDNYIDDTVLTLLSKRKPNVTATIYTKTINKQLQLDLAKHKQQYPEITKKTHTESHDRFLIINQTELYHIGASLKDLGKKWFAFSKMNSLTAEVLKKLN
jgi:hypothetical protein